MVTRDAPRLLRTVNKRPHATDDDHEGPPSKRTQSPAKIESYSEDLNAEPASSDNEVYAPPARGSRSTNFAKTVATANTLNSSQELKIPQMKSARAKSQIRPPSKGSFENGRVHKSGTAMADDKENTQSSQTSVVASDGAAWEFDPMLSQPKARGQKKTFDAKSKRTNNIHAQTLKRPGQELGSRKRKTFGKQQRRDARDEATPQYDDDLSDVSMMSHEEETKKPDPELRTRTAKPRSTGQGRHSPTAVLGDDELEKVLKEEAVDKELKRASRRAKPNQLLDQLGDWVQDQPPESSQPESSAPQEHLENIDDYLEQLPEEVEEGTICPICKAQIEPDDYWQFWKGQEKTVKNQNTFCLIHRRNEAQTEYRSEGYPDIDWSSLPDRIRKHRMDLFKILNDDRPSTHRDRYKPLALTGKAATVPKIRKDLPEHIQKDLEANTLDDQSTYPGYYGPHGRRIITEAVMKMLKNEIKNCTDPVVQASGPATFVQAVLVPEAAIFLIMQDNLVDREEADEIRERTYDMGLLLNEEIDDRVEMVAQSDDENEYGGQ